MAELNDKQKNKLLAVAKVVEGGDLAVVERLYEVEEVFDKGMEEVKTVVRDVTKVAEELKAEVSRVEEMKNIPPPKGDKGDDGKEPSDERITSLIKPLIPGPVKPTKAELESLIKPLIPEVVDGVTPSREELEAIITPLIPQAKDGSPDTGDDIVRKINEMDPEYGAKISIEHLDIGDFEERMKKLEKAGINTGRVGGPGGTNLAVLRNGVPVGDTISELNFINGTLTYTAGARGPRANFTAPSGGGGGGQVNSVVAGTGISVDSTDPENPIVTSTITQYTDELAQDAIGSILLDSTEIDFTYDDATPTITASLKASSIDEAKLDASVNASLDLADSALQPADIASGTITARADDINFSGGSDGDVLTVQADGSLSLETPASGGGNVTKVGTPVNNQIGVWTGDGTIEGDASLTWDGTSLNIATAKNFQIAGTTILADAAGTTTLSNVDALDATTEATIEAAIDTLANLTSIQGRTVTLADAGANAIFGWDDVAGAYENLSQAEVKAVIGSASDTATGVVELATTAETDTGTDATRAVTPDGLSGSIYGKKSVAILASDPQGSAITTGNGKVCFRIPPELNGMNLVAVGAQVSTVSSSGTPTFMIRRSRRTNATTRSDADMLSTALTIDASEFDSVDATVAAAIDTANDDVVTGDMIYVDFDVAGTGTKGVSINLSFQTP